MWLIANVREADAPLMHVGEPVEVHVLAFPGRVFNAKISWVAPSIDANTHRLSVRADVENPDGELKPGMFANFSIITGDGRCAPAVPQTRDRLRGRYSARLGGAGTTVRSPRVRSAPGASPTAWSRSSTGSQAGEKVVTSGALFIDRAASGD